MQIVKIPIILPDEYFHGWPDVTLLRDKQTLLGVYNECLAHCDRRHTRIMSIRSTDGGHTWNGPMPLAPASDNTGWYYNCPRIQTLPDGTLLLLIDKIPLPPGKKLYEDAQNLMNAEVFLARSTDDGATWSPLQKLPLHGIVPSQVCITHTGRWIIGAHHPVNNRQCEYIIWSDDQGQSWSEQQQIASSDTLSLCEVSFVETCDHTLVGLLRENGFTGNDCMKVISRDNGKTWSKPCHLPIPGCHRPVVKKLQDGRYLITYRLYQGGLDGQQNFLGALTDAASLTVTERSQARCRIFPIDWDSSEPGDLGYSGWVQFPDGHVFVLSYIHDGSPKAQLRGYSIIF